MEHGSSWCDISGGMAPSLPRASAGLGHLEVDADGSVVYAASPAPSVGPTLVSPSAPCGTDVGRDPGSMLHVQGGAGEGKDYVVCSAVKAGPTLLGSTLQGACRAAEGTKWPAQVVEVARPPMASASTASGPSLLPPSMGARPASSACSLKVRSLETEEAATASSVAGPTLVAPAPPLDVLCGASGDGSSDSEATSESMSATSSMSAGPTLSLTPAPQRASAAAPQVDSSSLAAYRAMASAVAGPSLFSLMPPTARAGAREAQEQPALGAAMRMDRRVPAFGDYPTLETVPENSPSACSSDVTSLQAGNMVAAAPTTRNAWVRMGSCQAVIMPAAQPQRANGNMYWPEYWGISRQQLKDLLRELRSTPGWKSDNNVYDLVKEFIVPWTKGTGMGYALKVNAASPLEANVMVSHSWAENAEAFFETILRSTSGDDVLFVCALSLYQAEDGAGPTVDQQVGSYSIESPFRRVLEHIKGRGERSRVTWRHHRCAMSLPSVLAALGLSIFYMPFLLFGCVPSFTECTRAYIIAGTDDVGPSQERHDAMGRWIQSIEWRGEDCGPLFPLILLSALICMILSGVSATELKRLDIYRGRMVVVPNRECDIYTRLWCVYELFVASHLGVPVRASRTLASAGGSGAIQAKCTSERDAARIHREIAEAGHTFEAIDAAVSGLQMQRRLAATTHCIVAMCFLAMCDTDIIIYDPQVAHPRAHVAAKLVAACCVVSVGYVVCRRCEGMVPRSCVLVLGAFLLLCGSTRALLVFEVVSSSKVQHVLMAASSIFLMSGVTLLTFAIGSTFCHGPLVMGLRCRGFVRDLILVGAASATLWLFHDVLARVAFAYIRSMRSPPEAFSGLSVADYLLPRMLTSCEMSESPYPCSLLCCVYAFSIAGPPLMLYTAAKSWGVRLTGPLLPRPRCRRPREVPGAEAPRLGAEAQRASRKSLRLAASGREPGTRLPTGI